MAEAAAPDKVKLICGMISADISLFETAVAAMAESFSPAELVSDVMAFDFTHYYDEQMGSPLYRRFVSFTELIDPGRLVEAKVLTNDLEQHFADRAGQAGPTRPINLDPGYLAPSKLILASMKDFSHRIYLGRGVYGEVTLMYCKGEWTALGWTFPDYASGRYDGFLDSARVRLMARTQQESR